MRANCLSIAVGLVAVSMVVSIGSMVEATESGPSSQDKDGFLKDVESELANARWLETYNLNWRIWSQVAIVALSAGVTILTGLQAFGGSLSGQRIKIATLIVSATATAAALIPKNFQLQDEEYKYGAAVAQLIEIRDDVVYGGKAVRDVLPRFYAVEQALHGQYSRSAGVGPRGEGQGSATASPSGSAS